MGDKTLFHVVTSPATSKEPEVCGFRKTEELLHCMAFNKEPGFEFATQKSHIIWDDWKLQWKDNPERLPIQVRDVLAGEN